MTTEQVGALAADFWERAGAPEPYPRTLDRAIVTTTPVWIVRLDGLCPDAAQHWLRRRGLTLPLTIPERRLHGCILAYCGQAVIFVEAGLSASLDRVIVAHEFAHYLAQYERPRLQAIRRLGAAILPLLDGHRPARTNEKLAAALSGVPLGAHVHFMERTFDPRLLRRTAQVEREANELACELLAPRQDVVAAMAGAATSEAGAWETVLCERFGLAQPWAAAYALRLRRWARRRRSFSDLLGL
jgi:hypothetical protein